MLSGIYDNLDINEYHKDQSISATGIKLILDCPKRYFYEFHQKHLELDEKELAKQKEKYKLGRALHMLVLEPKKFDNTFYCMTESVNLATKIGKEIYAQAEAAANGRDILRTGEWEDIKKMAEVVKKHFVWEIMKNGKVEQSIFWRGGIFSTPLRARPDIFNDEYIIDIKTTESIKTLMKPGSIYEYGYHIQAAMQIDALRQLDGKTRKFGLFIVEKKPPFLTKCISFEERFIDSGRKEYLEGAHKYSECIVDEAWPGYNEKFEYVDLPGFKLIENKVDNKNERSLLCLTQ